MYVKKQTMDQFSNSTSLHVPLCPGSPLLAFADKMEELVNAGVKPTSCVLPCLCLHPNHAHSVALTVRIMKMTERENSSLLPVLLSLVRPMRSPVCLIVL